MKYDSHKRKRPYKVGDILHSWTVVEILQEGERYNIQHTCGHIREASQGQLGALSQYNGGCMKCSTYRPQTTVQVGDIVKDVTVIDVNQPRCRRDGPTIITLRCENGHVYTLKLKQFRVYKGNKSKHMGCSECKKSGVFRGTYNGKHLIAFRDTFEKYKAPGEYRSYYAAMWGQYTARPTNHKKFKKQDLKFTLTIDEFYNLLSAKECYWCGQSEVSTYTLKDGRTITKLMGIDRINSDIGYEIDNCVPCCTACNYAKNTDSVETFVQRSANVTITNLKILSKETLENLQNKIKLVLSQNETI